MTCLIIAVLHLSNIFRCLLSLSKSPRLFLKFSCSNKREIFFEISSIYLPLYSSDSSNFSDLSRCENTLRTKLLI